MHHDDAHDAQVALDSRTARVVTTAAAGIVASILAGTVMVNAKSVDDSSERAQRALTGKTPQLYIEGGSSAPTSLEAASETAASATTAAETSVPPVDAMAAPRRSAVAPVAGAPDGTENADSAPASSPEPEPAAAAPAPEAAEPPARTTLVTADPGGGLPPITVTVP